MKSSFRGLFAATGRLLVFAAGVVPAFAGSDTWSASPASGDWNTAANWADGTVPDAAGSAVFDTSAVTGLSFSATTQVGSLLFNAGANGYSIVTSSTFSLTISGSGIVNNSANTQSFAAAVDGAGGFGLITFNNFATAGRNTVFDVLGATFTGASGGDIEFRDSSNAGSGVFTLYGSAGGAGGGIVGFSDKASAGSGAFTVNGPSPGGGSGTGYLQFHGRATADNATVTNNAGVRGGATFFYNNSVAGSGTFTNNGATGSGGAGNLYFEDNASADHGVFTNHGGGGGTNVNAGSTSFGGAATMGSGTFINNGATSSGALWATTVFYTTATTGQGTFINNGGEAAGTRGGGTEFRAASGAGNSTFTNKGGSASNTFGGYTHFYETASAGNSTFTNEGGTAGGGGGGGLAEFDDYASAGTGFYASYAGTVSGANGGATLFHYFATAASGTMINYGSAVSGASAGSTQFFDDTVAGHATITNHGGTGDGANGADTQFYTSSSADRSTVTNNGGTVSGALGGVTQFRTDATAAQATLTANAGTVAGALGGSTQFLDQATAGQATLIANGGVGGGGSILFLGSSTGGTARVRVYGNGNLDISQYGGTGVTIGSVEGTGNVFLGVKTLTVGSNHLSTTFAGVIQDGGTGGGAGGKFNKAGLGTLTLTGANTYTGATIVNGGTLVADTDVNATVLSVSSTLTVGGGAFQFKGNSGAQTQTLAGLAVNQGGSVVSVNNLGTSTTLDLGGITRSAGGTVDFSASNGSFGTDAVVKTSQANVNGILGAWATVNGGAAFATKDASNQIVAYTGYTALDAQGGGANPTIASNTALNYGINAAGASGSVTLASGTTNINTLTQNFSTASVIDASGKALRVGTSGGVFITPGNAALTIGTAVNSGSLTAGGSAANVAGELILGNFSTGALTINSIVANNGTGAVSLTKTGGGQAVISGSNTFTGGTTLNAGLLTVSNTAALGAAARALRLTGGTLDLATDTTVNAWNTTVSAPVTILSNKATAASAGITHTLGTLGMGAQTLSIGAGANVAADSGFGVTFGATALSGDAIFDVANNGAGVGTLTLGKITDGGRRTITKTGAGALIFGTAATGSTVTLGTALVINNGVAQVNVSNALGTTSSYASLIVSATGAGSTATFKMNGIINQKIGSLTLGGAGATSTSLNSVATASGTLTLGGNVVYDATNNPLGATISGILAMGGDSRTFTVGDSSNADVDLAISANIVGSTPSGFPSLIKDGAGTLVLAGSNGFNRGLSINAGVLSVGTLPAATSGGSSLGNGGTVQIAGGTLRYTGATQSTSHVFAMSTHGGGIDLTQAGTVLTISGTFNGAGSGVLSDALVKTGDGTLVLAGSVNNDGLDVIVNAGLLQLAKSSTATRHAISKNLVVNAGGTAQLATAGMGGDQIQDDATVTVNAGGTFDFNAKSETFDGLGGGGSITNTGLTDSLMTVGAKNHLAGETTFSGVISNGATGKMALTKTGLGVQILTGANTYTGTTAINVGTLQLGDGSSDGDIANGSAIRNNARLVYHISGTQDYGGTISGTGILIKEGLGTQVLSGTNTYTGATVVNEGRLVIDGDNLAATGAVIVNEGGSLGGAGALGGELTILSGGTLSPGNSPGQLDLAGALTLEDGAVLLMEFGGTSAGDYDRLNVQGVFTAGGTLNLWILDDYHPVGGASFTIFNGPTPGFDAGGFTITSNLGGGLSWDTSQLASFGVVSIVPEPSALALAGAALCALAFRRRRVR